MIKTAPDHQLNIQHVVDILRPPHPKLKKTMRGKWRNHGVMVEKKRRRGGGSELESYRSVF